eukprot:641405-Pyramimonas_sp.AAC.1
MLGWRRGHWIEAAPENGPWTLVSSEACVFDAGSAVAEAELSAAERLRTGVEHIVKDMFSAKRRRRILLALASGLGRSRPV